MRSSLIFWLVLSVLPTWVNAATVPIRFGGTGQRTAATAINALLPSQTGNSGAFLTTNGSSASWASVGGTSPETTITSSTVASSSYVVYFADPTGGAFNFTLPDAALNQGLEIEIKHIGFGSSNQVTLLSTNSNNIEGAAAASFPPIGSGDAYRFKAGMTAGSVAAWFIIGRQ